MADPLHHGNAERIVDQALIALKKGAQLLKYDSKGKPKLCTFRLSQDDSYLIWLSSGRERKLKLSSVTKVVPGQRTPIFLRHLQPEKEYLSFSLIYNNGKQSLDVSCKDKAEADLWLLGLENIVFPGHCGRSKIDGRSDGGLYFNDSRDLTSTSASEGSVGALFDTISPEPSKDLKIDRQAERSNVELDRNNMQLKGASSEVYRVSVSSAPSTSSHGSAQDDYDGLGDVYIWGEVICDNVVPSGSDKTGMPLIGRVDILLPRPLVANVPLDVHQIACGVHHAALVTRQGEVFTWGEESGGHLGHGIRENIIQPRLVESLSFNSEFVACGEFHTCAVTISGELYTWGDGIHNVGLLGHGSDVSHWIPKRVAGPLEGIQVAYVTCGTWHTALITASAQLFTFGDGTFGVLGHGNRESVMYPREVESLMGLKTIAVACGVWHTAAAVEVIVAQSSNNGSSGKLFTWGDGDKNRLGHGDKDSRLKPTCVASLIDHNFHKLACGHSLTVGLTTSGQVFTMGSTVYGQLGSLHSDGKLPCLVEDKLVGEFVEDIACGAYHVAVLTSKNEVYTWGKGANGRLGHGDVEDRKIPTVVDALKDRYVKHIACGSNFSAAICIHRWVSSSDQSQCSMCRQAFGFTRKKHNCYNCGLVHCHSCSSKKALRAALSPNPNKPYRVCDSCYVKLSKMAESSGNYTKRSGVPRLSSENKDRLEKGEIIKLSKAEFPNNMDLIKYLDTKAAKHGKKSESFALIRTSQFSSMPQKKEASFSTAGNLRRIVPKPSPSSTPSGISSRAVSPFSRRLSPPRSATPIPTTSGLSFSKNIADSLKKTNELLKQEVLKLRSQVDTLRQRCEIQELELQKSGKKVQEAAALAAEESAKSKAAKEVIKSLTAQLKDMAERMPTGVYDNGNKIPEYLPNGMIPNGIQGDTVHAAHSPSLIRSSLQTETLSADVHNADAQSQNTHRAHIDGKNEHQEMALCNHNGNGVSHSAKHNDAERRTSDPIQNGENGSQGRNHSPGEPQVEAEWIEQYEPGVYITLIALRDGTRDLKRVRFSRRRFKEHQAECWWSENRERVYEKYNVRETDRASTASSVRRSEDIAPPSQP